MSGRDKFITGCCDRICCGDCRLLAENLANCDAYCGAYDFCPDCPKGETCAVITWVCDVTVAELASRERYRLYKLEGEQRKRELAEARARETPEQRAQREALEQAKEADETARAKAECEARGQVYWDWNVVIRPPITLNHIMGLD